MLGIKIVIIARILLAADEDYKIHSATQNTHRHPIKATDHMEPGNSIKPAKVIHKGYVKLARQLA